MKKWIRWLAATLLSSALVAGYPAAAALAGETQGEEDMDGQDEAAQEGEASAEEASGSVTVNAPSAILLELHTGKVICEKNADERRSPASITKIMTLLLVFDALEEGRITLKEEAVASAHAKSMGGSQVYLEEGEKQTVETLIKCIVVASGNDASVTMAEHLSGSEEAFVAAMNEKASDLGLVNTHFTDCCGLTDDENHYTTARDVACMSRELVENYPEILAYSSIWMETITHETRQGSSAFGLTNTNKLIRSFPGCVGLKTGSTSQAKFCVSAVASRDGETMLAVVMGAETPTQRFEDAAALLDYGFAACSLYEDDPSDLVKPVAVHCGKKETARCRVEESFLYADTKGADLSGVTRTVTYREEITAPLAGGEAVGEITYSLDGEIIGSVRIVSAEAVGRAGYLDYLSKAGRRYALEA